jgi:regulator of sigma E protease
MNILAGIIVLSLSILIHELGHLLFGKLVGIKARVFSFGYGKGIFKKQFGDTVYQITAIPLGGYVQFYGDELANRDNAQPGDFFYVTPLKRIVPVIGGPLANLILGILIFAVFNFMGYDKPSAKVMITNELTYSDEASGLEKKIQNPSHLAGLRSGDLITFINGEKIDTYADLKIAVIFNAKANLEIEFKRDGKKRVVNVTPVVLKSGGYPIMGVQPFGILGFEKVLEKGSFDKAGLKKDDLVLSINNKKPESIEELAKMIQENGGKSIQIEFERNGKKISKSVLIDIRPVVNLTQIELADYPLTKIRDYRILHYEGLEDLFQKKIIKVNGIPVTSKEDFIKIIGDKSRLKQKIEIETGSGKYRAKAELKDAGYAGVVFRYMKVDSTRIEYGLLSSLGMGMVDAWNFIDLNFRGMKKLFSGDLSVQDNLSGPIRIAKIAGDVAEHGIGPLFLFLAQISVVLMIMNLLPIPVVDGGHIMFFILEAIMGRPLSQKVQERIMAFGIFFLVSLGVYVIMNDLLSLDFIKNFMQGY